MDIFLDTNDHPKLNQGGKGGGGVCKGGGRGEGGEMTQTVYAHMNKRKKNKLSHKKKKLNQEDINHLNRSITQNEI
jgi:hypothetical protein